MHKIALLFLFLLTIVLQTVSAKDTVVVLQNGLNDYLGCMDTYVYDGYYDSTLDSNNYEGEEDLVVFWGNNGSR